MNEITFSDKYFPLFEILQGKHPEVDTVILTGGRGCFYPDQKVVTEKGSKEISLIKKGDKVLSYNESTKVKEYKKVTNTFQYSNNKIYRIKLKNGTEIKATEDHKFYHNGGWIKLKDLLSLFYGNMENNTKI